MTLQSWVARPARHEKIDAGVGSPPACGGKIEARAVIIAGADSERLLDEHLRAINAGIAVEPTREVERSAWLDFALNPLLRAVEAQVVRLPHDADEFAAVTRRAVGGAAFAALDGWHAAGRGRNATGLLRF